MITNDPKPYPYFDPRLKNPDDQVYYPEGTPPEAVPENPFDEGGGKLNRMLHTAYNDAYVAPQQQYPEFKGKEAASQTLAHIHRRDWENYKRRFLPELDRLIKYAGSDVPVKESVERSGLAVERGFDAGNASFQRDLSRYGLSESDEERSDRMRLSDAGRAAAKTQAMNRTRLHAQDVQSQILSGNLATGLRSTRTLEENR